MRHLILAAVAVVLIATPLSADCPCVPISHPWTVKTCADWNCASTELLLASGDPQVMAIPVSMDDVRWLIVRRSATGSAIDDPQDPFALTQFAAMSDAVDHFNTIGGDMKKRLMSAPDGRVLVIALKKADQPPARRHASSR